MEEDLVRIFFEEFLLPYSPICLLREERWIGLDWPDSNRAYEWNGIAERISMRPTCIFTF